MTNKQLYEEGDFFSIKIKRNRYVIGLIARDSSNVILAYFFDSVYESEPDIESVKKLTVLEALAIWRVGDLGFIQGAWKVLGAKKPWRRDDYPVPDFIRKDMLLPNKGWLVSYSDDNLLTPFSTRRILLSDYPKCDEDALFGYEAAETKLLELLGL